MNYIGFENELKELVKKELGRDVQISFEVVEKNNGKSEESIVFYKQKECSQIVVGLPGLYEIYRTTENMWYSFERILDILRRGERISVDEAFCDWERIKGLISMRLINLEWNRLKGLVYKEFFNLAVTFHAQCQLVKNFENRTNSLNTGIKCHSGINLETNGVDNTIYRTVFCFMA